MGNSNRKYKRWSKKLKECIEGDFETFGEVFVDIESGEMRIMPDELLPFCEYINKNEKELIQKFSNCLDDFIASEKKLSRKVEQFMVKYEENLSLLTKLEMSFYMQERKTKIEGLVGIGSAFLLCFDKLK
jgi:hypothetical protein